MHVGDVALTTAVIAPAAVRTSRISAALNIRSWKVYLMAVKLNVFFTKSYVVVK